MTHEPPPLPLFYRQPRVLQPGLHGGRALDERGRYPFATAANAVPLLAAELPQVARQSPIVFSADATPAPLVVLGLRAGQNLSVDAAGQWQGGAYVPAYLRRYPFIFLEDAARQQLTLCIDEAATVAADESTEAALFTPTGEPTALTRDALAFCRDYQAHHLLTIEFGEALAAADLLVERRADITLDDGHRLGLAGFRVIDESRFARLPAELLPVWHAKGWLPLVHAHLQSLGNWGGLVARANGMAAGTAEAPAVTPSKPKRASAKASTKAPRVKAAKTAATAIAP